MRKRTAWLAILAVLVVAVGYLFIQVRQHGFSALEKPSRFEEFLARHARKIATPSDTKSLKNPYPATQENFAAGREHFAEDCASCHGFDGRGDTVIGRNLYPKAPDMTDAETQKLSDGELYYVIHNGVRFTGMPGWGREDSPEEIWHMVNFIRHLPKLTPEEIQQMREGAEGGAEGAKGRETPPTHGSGAKPHKH
jgi:mono/diheme cytochrome c family protein